MKKILSSAIMFSMVLSMAIAPITTKAAAGDLAITCGAVTINGNVWTLTGTWQAIDYGGTSGQYDVGVAAPTGTYVDESSKDSPDTYTFTQGPGVNFAGVANKDDMKGNWSNTITFATAPASISAALYHSKTQGNEISADATCTFTLPPQCSDGIDNDNDGFTDFAGGDPGCTDANDTTESPNPKTNPTISVTNSPVTYNASPQSATVVGSVAGVVSDVKYDGSSTSPTNVGTYAVTADFAPTDSASYNSLADASAGNFVINKADTTTTVTCSNVTYTGVAQTPCTATVTGPGLSLNPTPVYSDNINAGTASAEYTYVGNSNYNPSDDSTDFTIAKANAGLNVTGYTGTYDGLSHGAFGTATGVLSELLSGLTLGSSFIDVPGGIANWVFTDSTGNYNDDAGNVGIVISPRDITVTADDKGKNFGDSDPALTYTLTSGSLVSGDNFSGDLARDAGEDIGTYTINQGTLALDANYTLNFESGDFVIGETTINVTADPQTKVYGSADPILTYGFSPSLEDGDDFSGTLSRSAGEDVGIYGIGQGDLSLDSNYNLSFTGNDFEITPASITVTADPKTKVYGSADPSLTYQITSGSLVGSDTLSGALSRDLGEDVGTYSINSGTIANANYDITYSGANLVITKADQTITFDPLTDKVMGDADFDVNATASSGLSVTFTIGEGSTCTISGNTIHITGVGTCTVIAHQDGNDNYNAADDVSQAFTIATLLHTITSSTGGNGTISPLGTTDVADGENQAFSMTADSGYNIGDVLVDSVSVGAVSNYAFTNVTADHTISVSFVEEGRFTLTIDTTGEGNGVIVGSVDDVMGINCDSDAVETDCSETYPTGTVVTLTVTPAEGSNFDDSWAVGAGTCTGNNTPCTVTVSSNTNLTAHFSQNPPSADNSNRSSGGGRVGGGGGGQVLGAATEICNAVDAYMRKGYKNNMEQVKVLQDFLNGYMKSGLASDGVFGPKTENAVKAFQIERKDTILTPWGLTAPTGIFYKTSLAEAKRLMCPETFGTLPIPTDLIPWSKNTSQIPLL